VRSFPRIKERTPKKRAFQKDKKGIAGFNAVKRTIAGENPLEMDGINPMEEPGWRKKENTLIGGQPEL